ncbi:MAG: SDR family oxidoreductase [Bacteroides sp.]|nr:SDR family oxidoreductase [Bacteroides sp.]
MEKKKRVFVTGCAHGIGKAVVEAFAERGNRVAFCDVNKENGKALQAAIPEYIRFFETDVQDASRIESCMNTLFNEWGDIDIIINNAGIGEFAPITETTIADFDKILATNLRPAFLTSRLLAIHRSKLSQPNKYGRIINIASTRWLMSEPGSEGYAASKGGIYSLTHALAISMGQYYVTVNCISPGWIDTGAYGPLTKEDHEQHPSRRVGCTEDIANTCLFLCEEKNNFINGENIVVDGGMTKKMIYV